MVAPEERYVGNTDQRVTEDMVERALKKCASGLADGEKLKILKVERNGEHLQARTKSWKVTVPYGCRELLDNPACYPPGWTHRAFFAPRGENNKKLKHSSGQNSNAYVESLLQDDRMAEQERIQKLVEEQVAARLLQVQTGVPQQQLV